ncbi:hypothetical protein BACT_0062 [Bifidobacterium actinocoloniiforme DSM 22766]|uniref:Uncharacterized protein n=1 Tax=Bifidobacterium actinocoloniiforme DSM 22766 TaxID=1437605 RepID=A0A086YWF7_9BIFI|nr:hypothetical protein [Bifidobacterium actinocoloniiforme]AKV55804.1 hypothetical protein AB656_06115 [Bifidobacterium actinocoloniiforme DSM 22766]KFI38607.1 hypothetical protein BACT_0062 [Bifidobacterium actinocoloniiforme DSM 22766]
MRKHSLRMWTNGRAWLVAILAFAVALAMVVAVMPSAHADTSTYTTDDDFLPGDTPDSTHPAKLVLTKLLTSKPGFTATGSIQDKTNSNMPDNQVGKGVPFKLTQITPPGGAHPGDMKPNQENTFVRRTEYVGMTDDSGVIQNGGSGIGHWHTRSAGGYTDTTSLASFPHGYYLLEEVTGPGSGNPYTDPSNPLFNPRYTPVEKAIYDLPYRSTNTTTPSPGGTPTPVEGFVYNLHIYPKNINDAQLIKQVVSVKKPNGASRDKNVAQVGDTVTWKITQKLYDDNHTTSPNGDGRLDLSEIPDTASTADALALVDVLPTSLDLVSGSVHVALSWTDNNVAHQPVTTGLPSFGDIGRSNMSRPVAGHSQESMVDPSMRPDTQKQNRLLSFEVKNGSSLKTLYGNYVSGNTYTDIQVAITYDTKVTAEGDGDAGPMGLLTNVAVSDNLDNSGSNSKPFSVAASVASPGFQFAKTNKAEASHVPPITLAGVPGAVFRLTDPSDRTQFLCDDAAFHTDTQINSFGGRVKAIEATSNENGIVTFTGIPIVDDTANAVYSDASKLKFGMVEYKKPQYCTANCNTPSPTMTDYLAPSANFKTVDFSSLSGKPIADLQDTEVKPDVSKLDFKDYKTPSMPTGTTSTFKNMRGDVITLGLTNWQQDQTDPAKVGALPLTGGRGILLMLIIGLIIMVIGLVVSKQRERRMAARGAY